MEERKGTAIASQDGSRMEKPDAGSNLSGTRETSRPREEKKNDAGVAKVNSRRTYKPG